MDTEDLIRRWRERRREILNGLPAELRAEYLKLGKLIKAVRAEQAPIPKNMQDMFSKYADQVVKDAVRIHMSRHKEKLVAFLAEHGPSTRKEITEATQIPPGSLSMLLSGAEFESVARGLWRLRGSGQAE